MGIALNILVRLPSFSVQDVRGAAHGTGQRVPGFVLFAVILDERRV